MTTNSSIQDSGLDITVIIDRSGSMEEMRDDAIGSFNTFLSDRKKSDPDALMTIVLFDDKYEILMNGTRIMDVPPFTRETFVPRGSTALLDAIGKTIGAIQSRPHLNDTVIIAILTDGQENASKEWSGEQIRNLILSLEEKGWDFYYLSAALNAFDDGERIGIQNNKNLPHGDMDEAYRHFNEALLRKKMFLAQKMKGSRDEDTMYQ